MAILPIVPFYTCKVSRLVVLYTVAEIYTVCKVVKHIDSTKTKGFNYPIALEFLKPYLRAKFEVRS